MALPTPFRDERTKTQHVLFLEPWNKGHKIALKINFLPSIQNLNEKMCVFPTIQMLHFFMAHD